MRPVSRLEWSAAVFGCVKDDDQVVFARSPGHLQVGAEWMTGPSCKAVGMVQYGGYGPTKGTETVVGRSRVVVWIDR